MCMCICGVSTSILSGGREEEKEVMVVEEEEGREGERERVRGKERKNTHSFIKNSSK